MLPTIARAATTVGDSTFYGRLTEAERTELLSAVSSQRLHIQGRIFLREGEAASQVTVVLEGWAKAVALTPAGEVVLRIYGPGDIVGAAAAASGQREAESVTFLVRGRTVQLSASDFNLLLLRNPGIARALNAVMQDRLQQADETVRSQFYTPTVRLVHRLLGLAERFGVAAPDGVTIPVELSQTDLGSWTGVSRVTVARVLRELRNIGLISTGYRRITITNIEQLRRLADPFG